MRAIIEDLKVGQNVFFKTGRKHSFLEVTVVEVDKVNKSVTGQVMEDGKAIAELVWPIRKVFLF